MSPPRVCAPALLASLAFALAPLAACGDDDDDGCIADDDCGGLTDAAALLPDAAAGSIDAAAPSTDGRPGAGHWEGRASLPGTLQEDSVVALDGKIYAIGGFAGFSLSAAVQVYDPVADQWSQAVPLPRELHHVNAAVVDGRIYVLGALYGFGFDAVADAYDWAPGEEQWSEHASLPVERWRGASAVGVIGTDIYVAGGFRDGDSVAYADVYSTTQDQWTPLLDLPAPRDHLVGGVVNDVFYVIGGRSGGVTGVTGAVVSYNIAGGWTPHAAMPTPRGGCAAALLDGRIIVVGGEGNGAVASGVFPDVEAYDPVADAWEPLARMRTPRHGTGAAVVDGVYYVPGGADSQGFGAVDVCEAFLP